MITAILLLPVIVLLVLAMAGLLWWGFGGKIDFSIMVIVSVLLSISVPLIKWKIKKDEEARLENECVERERKLLEDYGKLDVHEMLLNKALNRTDKRYLLSTVHNYSDDEINALMGDAEKAEIKAKLSKVRRGIYQKANEMYDVVPSDERTRIPDDVQQFVWRRDKGCCVKCGSNEKLEFDHIIPFSKGGSNTERNLQLLCEACNRGKSNKI